MADISSVGIYSVVGQPGAFSEVPDYEVIIIEPEDQSLYSAVARWWLLYLHSLPSKQLQYPLLKSLKELSISYESAVLREREKEFISGDMSDFLNKNKAIDQAILSHATTFFSTLSEAHRAVHKGDGLQAMEIMLQKVDNIKLAVHTAENPLKAPVADVKRLYLFSHKDHFDLLIPKGGIIPARAKQTAVPRPLSLITLAGIDDTVDPLTKRGLEQLDNLGYEVIPIEKDRHSLFASIASWLIVYLDSLPNRERQYEVLLQLKNISQTYHSDEDLRKQEDIFLSGENSDMYAFLNKNKAIDSQMLQHAIAFFRALTAAWIQSAPKFSSQVSIEYYAHLRGMQPESSPLDRPKLESDALTEIMEQIENLLTTIHNPKAMAQGRDAVLMPGPWKTIYLLYRQGHFDLLLPKGKIVGMPEHQESQEKTKAFLTETLAFKIQMQAKSDKQKATTDLPYTVEEPQDD